MFDIPLLINLFIPLTKQHPLKTLNKRTGVNLKQIKQPATQTRRLQQRMTLAKTTLQCILKYEYSKLENQAKKNLQHCHANIDDWIISNLI